MNRTLEELHESREQVRHYQKLQTIGALAGGIVHEFNNLLTPIMGYSEFLKQQLGPENEYYEDIDEIYKAGGRAKEIVAQILPFSRRETDSTQYNVVNLNAVIWDALKMVRMLLPSSVRLVVKPYSGPINIYGSATQIHQVLLNLCTNAYQAMESTGGERSRWPPVGFSRTSCRSSTTRWRRGSLSGLRCLIPAAGFPRRCSPGSLTRFSPPRRRETGPGWGCLWCRIF